MPYPPHISQIDRFERFEDAEQNADIIHTNSGFFQITKRNQNNPNLRDYLEKDFVFVIPKKHNLPKWIKERLHKAVPLKDNEKSAFFISLIPLDKNTFQIRDTDILLTNHDNFYEKLQISTKE